METGSTTTLIAFALYSSWRLPSYLNTSCTPFIRRRTTSRPYKRRSRRRSTTRSLVYSTSAPWRTTMKRYFPNVKLERRDKSGDTRPKLKHIEHGIGKRRNYVMDLFQRMESELAVLGFISFALFVAHKFEASHAVAKRTKDSKWFPQTHHQLDHVVHVAHVALFLGMVFYFSIQYLAARLAVCEPTVSVACVGVSYPKSRWCRGRDEGITMVRYLRDGSSRWPSHEPQQ